MRLGARFGEWVVTDALGEGAMGAVFAVRHARTGERAACKVLTGSLEPVALARFAREASAGSLRHPNVLAVRETGVTDGQPFIVMELAQGGSLARRIERAERLPAREVATIGEALARGLAALHAAGFVHRDVKPSNILFDEHGTPKLADFGLVRPLASEGTLTGSNAVVGTPSYFSPEQANGVPAVPASDVYALGCTLHAALTGGPPFTGSAIDVLRYHLGRAPPDARATAKETPEALARLVKRCLAKDPAARGTALEVARELGDIARPAPTNAAAPRARFAAGIALLVLGCGAAAAAVALRRSPETLGLARDLAPPTSRTAAGADLRAEARRLLRTVQERRDHRAPPEAWRSDLAAAQAAAEKALRARAADRETRLVAALVALEVADADERADRSAALAAATAVLELEPTCARAFALRADARYRSRDKAAAVADLDRAIEIEPKNTSFRARRCSLRVFEKDFGGAEVDATSVILAEPRSFPAWQARALARQQLGELDLAIQDATRALELEPRDLLSINVRAGCRIAKGEIESGLADTVLSLALEPLNVGAVIDVYEAHRIRGDIEKALPLLDEAVAAHPDRELVRRYRARARIQAGDLEGALEDHERLAETGEDRVRTQLALAFAERARERGADPARARADLERARALAAEGEIDENEKPRLEELLK